MARVERQGECRFLRKNSTGIARTERFSQQFSGEARRRLPILKRPTLRIAKRLHLFATKRDDDLFVATAENYAAIFDPLDRDLINLGADLKSECLTFRHGFTIDDREVRGAVERDGADNKCARRNFALVGSARRNFSGWFPADRPKWTSGPNVDVERRFVLEDNRG